MNTVAPISLNIAPWARFFFFNAKSKKMEIKGPNGEWLPPKKQELSRTGVHGRCCVLGPWASSFYILSFVRSWDKEIHHHIVWLEDWRRPISWKKKATNSSNLEILKLLANVTMVQYGIWILILASSGIWWIITSLTWTPGILIWKERVEWSERLWWWWFTRLFQEGIEKKTAGKRLNIFKQLVLKKLRKNVKNISGYVETGRSCDDCEGSFGHLLLPSKSSRLVQVVAFFFSPIQKRRPPNCFQGFLGLFFEKTTLELTI